MEEGAAKRVTAHEDVRVGRIGGAPPVDCGSEACGDGRVKSAVGHDGLQIADRSGNGKASEVAVEGGFHLVAGSGLRFAKGVKAGNAKVDEGCTERFHGSGGVEDDAVDLGVPVFGAEHVAKDADARVREGGGVQMAGEGAGDVAQAGARRLVFGVEVGNGVKQAGGVLHATGEWADGVLGDTRGHDAGAADEAARRAQSDEIQRRSRRADGLARIGADADQRQVGGNCHASAATRSAGGALQGVGIEGLSPQRTHRGAAERELMEVGFGEDEGTSGAKAPDYECISARSGAA